MTKQILARHSPRRNLRSAPRDQRFFARTRARPKRRRLSVSSFSLLAASSVVLQFSPVLSVGGFHYNATRRHCQSYGEATHHPSPPRRPQTPVHDLPCEASRSAKMGEGRSDRNLYAQVGAARRRNQGGDRAFAPTLGSKCRDLPGRPGEKGGNPSGGPWGRAGGGTGPRKSENGGKGV